MKTQRKNCTNKKGGTAEKIMGRQIKRFERREKYSLDEENKHFAERENRSER